MELTPSIKKKKEKEEEEVALVYNPLETCIAELQHTEETMVGCSQMGLEFYGMGTQ